MTPTKTRTTCKLTIQSKKGGKIYRLFYVLTKYKKHNIIYVLYLSGLCERGDGEKPSMRKVRAFQEQGAGEIPVKATLRKVQQKITAPYLKG